MRRQRQRVGIDHRIDHHRAAPVRERLFERFSHVAWFFDADVFRAHCWPRLWRWRVCTRPVRGNVKLANDGTLTVLAGNNGWGSRVSG